MDQSCKINLTTLLRPQLMKRPIPADNMPEPAIKKNALAQNTPNPFLVDQRYALGLDEII